MKTFNFLLALLLLSPIGNAIAEHDTKTLNHKVEADGTTVTTEKSHNESFDSDGSRSVEEKERTAVDPKGMLNKKTAETVTEREVGPNGDYTESVTTKHADGTKDKYVAERETSKHILDNGKTTTTTVSRSVDPAGLGNKSESLVKEEIVTNPDGSKKKTFTKKSDGGTVSKETEETTVTH